MVAGKDFTRMDKLALEFLSDYNLYTFPLDIFKIATDILNAKLVFYSSLNYEQLKFIKSKDPLDKGYTIIEQLSNGTKRYIIFLNDYNCPARQRYTLAHEIKHILCEDINFNEDEEILADYFAKVLLAPKCVVLENNYSTLEDIMIHFGLSEEASINYLNAINNRKYFYERELFDFEREYMIKYNEFTQKKD